MNAINKKGLLVLFEPSLNNEFEGKLFSTDYYKIFCIDISLYFGIINEITSFFTNIIELDIIIITHGALINNEYRFVYYGDSFEIYFKSFEQLNSMVTKNVLVTCCYGLYAHIYLRFLKEGSTIISLSNYNTLCENDWVSLILFNPSKNLEKEKNIILYFLVVKYRKIQFSLYIYYPFISTIKNGKRKMSCLFDNAEVENIEYYYNLFNVLQQLYNSLLNTTNDYYEENLLEIIDKIFYSYPKTKQVLLKELCNILTKNKKPFNRSKIYYVHHYKIIKEFQRDDTFLLKLNKPNSREDFGLLEGNKEMTLNLNQDISSYLSFLHQRTLKNPLLNYNTILLDYDVSLNLKIKRYYSYIKSSLKIKLGMRTLTNNIRQNSPITKLDFIFLIEIVILLQVIINKF